MMKTKDFKCVKEAQAIVKHRMEFYNKMMAEIAETRECNALDKLREEFGEPTSAAYLSLLRLAKKLEKERNVAQAEIERLQGLVE